QVRVVIDGREVVVRTGAARNLTEREAVFLERGRHALEVEYTSPAEAPFLRVLWSPGQGGPRGFAAEEVTPQPTHEAIWRSQRLRQVLQGLLLGAMAALMLLLLAWRARHGGIVRGLTRLGASDKAARRFARGAAWALPIAIMAYGAALRIEALEGRLWASAAPRWVQRVAQTAEALRFDGLKWYPAERRYDGDPAQYLEYAREPRSFYEAHRREPLFVYATRLGLWLTGGDDIGISLASLLSSALAVGAAYLVGAQAFSPAVGLLAAFLLAVERQMIALSIEGWRDDTFLLFVLLSTWAVLRLDERPSVARGALLGLFGALACLTRITALSFLLPALALVALRQR
ncbi:MAG TPA: glycosyltransferase family 39 protein, partial [Vicinamibacteria bacterium]|nr:glycosyltransferase family 39 protein [Vicinamibacteria bacterium]